MKVVAISYCYPPMTTPRAIQVGRALSRLDAGTLVVCATTTGVDKGIATLAGRQTILRVPHRVSPMDRVRLSVGLRTRLPLRRLPDNEAGWVDPAYHALRAWLMANTFSPDAVVSFGHPMSGHLVGLRCKRDLELPWIAHFSDPWVDNPYSLWTRTELVRIRKLEEEVIGTADLCVFTSLETIELVLAKYPADWHARACVIPHCYEPALFDGSAEPPKNLYVLRSLGSMYGVRSPGPLLNAIEAIAKGTPSLLVGTQIELIGDLGVHARAITRFARRTGLVRVSPAVNYIRSLDLMTTAHCLLLVDGPASPSPFFPSKLVEYLGSGRHIFAITPPGCSERLVRAVGGTVASPLDSASVERALAGLLRARPKSCGDGRRAFTAASVAPLWQEALSRVVGG